MLAEPHTIWLSTMYLLWFDSLQFCSQISEAKAEGKILPSPNINLPFRDVCARVKIPHLNDESYFRTK